jgi:hypothetical protein
MKLPMRELFAMLERPMRLLENFGLNLQGRFSRPPMGESHDGKFKPNPQNHSSITSNPLIPAFLLLTFGFLVLTSSPVTAWLTSSNDLPTLAKMFSFGRKQKPYTLPKSGEGVSVWTKQQSGFYYCAGGTLFGDKPGEVMTQANALMTGYRPADGKYCQNAQPVVASSGSPPVTSPQPADAADASLTAAESSSLGNDNIGVWAIKGVGLYYCRGGILFGSKPGKLMTQSDAVSAGYLPYDGVCTNGPSGTSAPVSPSISIHPPGGDNAAMIAAQSVAPNSAKPPAAGKTEQHVRVWVKSEFGFYYCQNDVLFGTKPGQLMTQSDALAAGYQASDGLCSNGKTTRTSAEVLSPPGLSGAK